MSRDTAVGMGHGAVGANTARGSGRLSLLPTADCRLPPRRRWGTLLLPGLLTILGILSIPRSAFADPHAVFYTDKGQEQVFYNVLAALNQADYVEPPDAPTPPATLPDDFEEFNYDKVDVDELKLPRIRVRAVTPDDGDFYYRLRLAEQIRALSVRKELSQMACLFYQYADPAEYERYEKSCTPSFAPPV